jgi:2,3-bisphosphoglycerate-independent phosphoglycerate mutase
VREGVAGRDVTLAVLPDHPVPVKQRVHTRDPVPVTICGAHITPDDCQVYSEQLSPAGGLGHFEGDALIRRILNV